MESSDVTENLNGGGTTSQGLEIEQKILEDVTEELHNIIKDDGLTVSSISSVLIKLMMFVERYKNLKGKDKKMLVLYVLKRIINESGDSDLISFVDLLLPTLIDNMISLDKGKLKINKSTVIKALEKVCIVCLAKHAGNVNK